DQLRVEPSSQQAARDLQRHHLPESQVRLEIMSRLVQDRAERPGVHQTMVWQLNQWERIGAPSQPGQWHSAAEGCGSESRLHIAKGSWGRDRPRPSQPRVNILVAIERNTVTGQQLRGESGLALTE